MKMQWIGTGSGLNPHLGNTSFLVKGTGERVLLVDCGSTVPLELIRQGRLKDVTDIVVTHTHADHIGGLEGVAFMNYFAYKNRGDKRPQLYVGSEKFAHDLWEYSLRGGLERIQFDHNGHPLTARLDNYFNVHAGNTIQIPGLPVVTLFPTPHVQNMENYGLRFDNGVFYSGDTVALPDQNANRIFQDCQFFEGGPGDVHISYNKLRDSLPPAVKQKTHLVHLGGGYEKKDPQADGFAGFIMPGQEFDI